VWPSGPSHVLRGKGIGGSRGGRSFEGKAAGPKTRVEGTGYWKLLVKGGAGSRAWGKLGWKLCFSGEAPRPWGFHVPDLKKRDLTGKASSLSLL